MRLLACFRQKPGCDHIDAWLSEHALLPSLMAWRNVAVRSLNQRCARHRHYAAVTKGRVFDNGTAILPLDCEDKRPPSTTILCVMYRVRKNNAVRRMKLDNTVDYFIYVSWRQLCVATGASKISFQPGTAFRHEDNISHLPHANALISGQWRYICL